jgi:hypothetical protein
MFIVSTKTHLRMEEELMKNKTRNGECIAFMRACPFERLGQK